MRLDQAACVFRFLPQPSRPSAPRPVAKSGLVENEVPPLTALTPAGLAFTDAFDLWGMEGVELPSRGFERGLAGDLAADVAHKPPEPAAQQPQLPPMTVELLGVGVASGHHRCALGDARGGV